ncbi:hypothetical protein AZE42_08541 [Rhizopogon vesiculosus]|uniref:Uncharacterized protein n=1 Tax=Rhizopogon vesiculosus TaxID=180088 RepID=A0A1J8PKF9_9AGAM|nr:hypothetical protein AZE42_08541 [Rhizopogon vesiculosus]
MFYSYYIGCLCVGINSSILSYFAIAFLSQWWLRTRYPRWFAKYNYIVGAALDGGTQVMVFILSFAVQGAGGNSHPFPKTLLAQFRQVAEELAVRKRKEREGEHERRKSMWTGGDRASMTFQPDKMPPLPDWMAELARKAGIDGDQSTGQN